MTANAARTPNHVHCVGSNTTVGHYFGGLVRPVCASPLKHHPHIIAHFSDGVRLELDPVTAMDLSRELAQAVAQLGIFPDCSGAVADVGGDE